MSPLAVIRRPFGVTFDALAYIGLCAISFLDSNLFAFVVVVVVVVLFCVDTATVGRTVVVVILIVVFGVDVVVVVVVDAFADSIVGCISLLSIGVVLRAILECANALV